MKSNSLVAIAALTASLTLAAAASPANASERLSGSWMRKNLPGKYTLVIYGFDIGVNASRNGSVKLTFLGDEMNGRWSVKGNELCITLTEGRRSKTACSEVHYDGKKYYSAAGLNFYAR